MPDSDPSLKFVRREIGRVLNSEIGAQETDIPL